MTLVEAVVSIALFLIVGLFVCTIFLFIGLMLNRTAAQKQTVFNAAGGVEQKAGNQSPPAEDVTIAETTTNFQVQFGTSPITANGNLINGKNGDAEYKYFVPNS